MSQDQCPTCGTKYKSGMLGSIQPLGEDKVKVINLYGENARTTYCTKCGSDLLKTATSRILKERSAILSELKKLFKYIPIVTADSPMNWDYEALTIVTGQTVIGTGVIAELSSDFNDLFGSKSNTLAEKLSLGEVHCAAQIRKKTIDQGGHAVLATDIDYSEMGSLRGMMMVCMSGTAVRLKNPEVLINSKEVMRAFEINQRLELIHSLNVFIPGS